MSPALKPANHPFGFIPLEPNKNLESNPRGHRDLTKGAFSDEARVALAMAVKDRKPTVQMDKWEMEITYYQTHLSIVSTDGSGLPCGVFYYEALRAREVK